MVGRLAFIVLTTRVPAAAVGAGFLAVQSVALVMLSGTDGAAGSLLWSCLFGLGVGVLVVIAPLLTRATYPAIPFTAVFPVVSIGYQLAIAAGAPVTAVAEASLGGYPETLLLLGVVDALATGLIAVNWWTTRRAAMGAGPGAEPGLTGVGAWVDGWPLPSRSRPGEPGRLPAGRPPDHVPGRPTGEHPVRGAHGGLTVGCRRRRPLTEQDVRLAEPERQLGGERVGPASDRRELRGELGLSGRAVQADRPGPHADGEATDPLGGGVADAHAGDRIAGERLGRREQVGQAPGVEPGRRRAGRLDESAQHLLGAP